MTEGNDPREFKKKYHRYHQNLFFYGQKVMDGETLHMDRSRGYVPARDDPYIDEARFVGGRPFFRVLPFFEIWYHPRPELLDLDVLRVSWLEHCSLSGMWKQAQKLLFVTGKNGRRFDSKYGAMGGRERLIVELCCPGLDFNKQFFYPGLEDKINPKFLKQEKDYLQPCPRPKELVHRCLHDTCWELVNDKVYCPNTAGQYFWDHLSYALEKYPDETLGGEGPWGFPWVDNKNRRRAVLMTIWCVLDFESRMDPVRNRPVTIEMVDRLIGRYERKEFSPTLMSLWEEAKGIKLTDKEKRFYSKAIKFDDEF